MKELIEKTQELKNTILSMKEVQKTLRKLSSMIEELQTMEKKILDEIEQTANQSLKKEFEEWTSTYQNYILWIIAILIELEKQKESITLEEEEKLTNLLTFLTKYNTIYNQVSNEEMNEKIQTQINDLFQNIFHTKERLIEEEKERRNPMQEDLVPYYHFLSKYFTKKQEIATQIKTAMEEKNEINIDWIEEYNKIQKLLPNLEKEYQEVSACIDKNQFYKEPIPDWNRLSLEFEHKPEQKESFIPVQIEPYFNEKTPLTIKTIKDMIFEYVQITNKSLEKVKEQLFPSRVEEKTLPVAFSFKIGESFFPRLDASIYQNAFASDGEEKKELLYPPNINRKIKTVSVELHGKKMQVSTNKELASILEKGGIPKRVESRWNNHLEGWFEIHEIKK